MRTTREVPLSPQFQRILSWARYLFWADLLLNHYLHLQSPSESASEIDPDWFRFALQSQWLGSEWVVIEGWQEAGFHDSVIDTLLEGAPDILDLLRRYRNAVFHYQPGMWDDRFDAFMQSAQEHVLWISSLHNEFLRYFWDFVQQVKSGQEGNAFRNIVFAVVGWIPGDFPLARYHQLEQNFADGERLVASASDPHAPHVLELKAGLEESRSMARKGKEDLEAHRRRLISEALQRIRKH